MSSKVKISEKDFQQQIIDLAKLYGWRCAHFRPALTTHGWRTPVSADGKGFPDLVLAHPVRGILFAELKSERGGASPEQIEWIELLGGEIWKPSDLERIVEVLRGY